MKNWQSYLTMMMALLFIGHTQAQKPANINSSLRPASKWFTALEMGTSHQVQTDLEGAGDFDLNTFFLNTSFGYGNRSSDSIALGVGYQNRAYGFDATNLLPPTDPWDQVHFLSLSLPIRKQLSDKWMMITVPTIRTMVEDMSDLDQNLTGGGIFGFSYEVNSRFKVGPGFGVISQIEDSTSIFPVIVVNWAITDKWTLQTGRSSAASQGPGLTLSYALNDAWKFHISGRYERFRFRMDQQGTQANGVGEDQNVTLVLGASYSLSRQFMLNAYTGLTMAGELSISTPTGNEIARQDYDTTPVVGFNLQYRF